eukprot:1960814-Karenia_brevis.AAC.1
MSLALMVQGIFLMQSMIPLVFRMSLNLQGTVGRVRAMLTRLGSALTAVEESHSSLQKHTMVHGKAMSSRKTKLGLAIILMIA